MEDSRLEMEMEVESEDDRGSGLDRPPHSHRSSDGDVEMLTNTCSYDITHPAVRRRIM